MLKISKPLAELFGFEWTKRPKFKLESKDLLHNPDFGKPTFHDNTGSRTDPRDQYIEISPLQDTYYTVIMSVIYKEDSVLFTSIVIFWRMWLLEM